MHSPLLLGITCLCLVFAALALAVQRHKALFFLLCALSTIALILGSLAAGYDLEDQTIPLLLLSALCLLRPREKEGRDGL